MQGKSEALRALAKMRREGCYPDYRNIGYYHNGAYDSLHVSPYTRGSGNPDSRIMFVLQDWSSHERLVGQFNPEVARLGRDERLPTNRNFAELLRVHFGKSLDQVYTTNVFPFIKQGQLSAAISRKDTEQAAKEFTLKEIEIVHPRLVVCLGFEVYRALRFAVIGTRYRGKFTDAMLAPFTHISGNSSISFCLQAHPGARGVNNRGRHQVTEDWRQMADLFPDVRTFD